MPSNSALKYVEISKNFQFKGFFKIQIVQGDLTAVLVEELKYFNDLKT